MKALVGVAAALGCAQAVEELADLEQLCRAESLRRDKAEEDLQDGREAQRFRRGVAANADDVGVGLEGRDGRCCINLSGRRSARGQVTYKTFFAKLAND